MPTDTETAPPSPVDPEPVCRINLPDEPLVAAPVLKLRIPETPLVPAPALAITTAPLLFVVPVPPVNDSAPPVVSLVAPEVS